MMYMYFQQKHNYTSEIICPLQPHVISHYKAWKVGSAVFRLSTAPAMFGKNLLHPL